MKLSLKVEYACRVLAQLARHPDRLAHIDELAKAEAIPANYLVQILNDLRNGGLINSRRGKQGGYALARNAGEIPLCEVVQVIEGELLAAELRADGMSGPRVAEIWGAIKSGMETLATQYTVADLVAADAEEMYYI